MANLVELFDNIVQMENLNGVPLANGRMYVYALGRTRLMDTWSDVDGESLNPNPIILDAAGQCHCYVSTDFDYTVVVTDEYNNEIFSIDKYLYSQGSHSHADVAVAPSETIAVSSYHVGETTVYVPYLTGQLGKVYQGIDPIVVNNTEDKISANHVPLGVQDPLYFVQDDEEGCIIGFSGQTVPEGVMTESALGFENDKITGYNGSAFSAGNEYEAGDNIDITNGVISGKDWTNEINDASAAATAWTDSQGYLTGVDLSEYAKESFVISAIDSSTSGLLPTSAFATASGSFITALPDDLATTGFVAGVSADIVSQIPSTAGLATEQWVENKGYLTAVDIPESAVWNATTQTVSANSAQWAGGTANPQIPVTGINGIKISESGDKVVFEVSANYATEDWVTGQGYLTAETDWTNTITAASANAYNEATAAIPTGLATTGDLQTVSGEITALIPSTAGLATEDWVTAQGYLTTAYNPEFAYHDTAISSIDNSALYDTSAHARINTLAGRISDLSSNKLDTTAFSTVSGDFLTAHQDLSDYQTIAGMTAYQSAGDYYSASNPSGFISTIPDTYLQNTDLNTTNGKISAISGIPLEDTSNVFVSEYGTTTYNEIASAYNAGKAVVCKYNRQLLNLCYTASDRFIFAGFAGAGIFAYAPTEKLVQCTTGNNWWDYSYGIQANWDEADNYAPAYIKNKPDLSTYLQNTDLTISDGKVTEISGVPLSAGDEFPQSATDAIGYVTATSANIDSTIDNVSANSGVWGGSALPVSAGKGVKISLQNDTLVFEADETVLYSGQATGDLTLSDSPLNYERLLITFNASTGTIDMGAGSEIFEPDKTHVVCLHNYFMYQTTQTAFNYMNEAWAVYTGVDTTAWVRTIGGWRNGSTYTSNLNDSNNFLKISKVIGINRIAGGN